MRIRNPKKSRVLGVSGVLKTLQASPAVACSQSNTTAEIPYTKAKTHQWCSSNQPPERTPRLFLPAGRCALSAAKRTRARPCADVERRFRGEGQYPDDVGVFLKGLLLCLSIHQRQRFGRIWRPFRNPLSTQDRPPNPRHSGQVTDDAASTSYGKSFV
jgi:hypothetical protein